MAKTISMEIDVCDALRMMDDDDIKKEALERDIDYSGGLLDEAFADGVEEGYAEGRESAITAINQIRTGRHTEAIVTLERAFLPRWQDGAECEIRYREAMAEKARLSVAQAQEAA
ncbi:MAG: hypothetical protein WBB98_04825 [Xanthobacteraceae bacterium]